MTTQDKLKTLIEKAIGNGWDAFGSESRSIDVEEVYSVNGDLQPDLIVDKPGTYICIHRHHGTYSVPEVVFNHDFINALIPNESHYGLECSNCDLTYNWWDETDSRNDYAAAAKYCNQCGTKLKRYIESVDEKWKRVLQRVVISEDPIVYMYDMVFGEQ